MPINTWPQGHIHAMSQDEHQTWNVKNYPGTLQLCSRCESPTGNCEEDSIFVESEGPLCEDCYTSQLAKE